MPFPLLTGFGRSLLSLLLLATFGTAALAQASAGELAPPLRQRVEALVRSRVELPPATTFTFRVTGPSDLPGFDRLAAHFTSASGGASGDLSLLLAKDGSRLAQLTTYNIADDPRAKVPSEGRPARGGPPTAPVLVVSFDDLECPFCAQLHQELFPALTDHYRDQVRVIYQSLPSEGHPWAMRAAIDTDCLGHLNPAAYWAAVDDIHQNASRFGGAERKLEVAEQQLDAETLDQGRRFRVDQTELNSCMKAQDTSSEKESLALASRLGVTHTPSVFVNGAKFEGAVPIAFVFDMVDNALRAEGQVPPPRQDVKGAETPQAGGGSRQRP